MESLLSECPLFPSDCFLIVDLLLCAVCSAVWLRVSGRFLWFFFILKGIQRGEHVGSLSWDRGNGGKNQFVLTVSLFPCSTPGTQQKESRLWALWPLPKGPEQSTRRARLNHELLRGTWTTEDFPPTAHQPSISRTKERPPLKTSNSLQHEINPIPASARLTPTSHALHFQSKQPTCSHVSPQLSRDNFNY